MSGVTAAVTPTKKEPTMTVTNTLAHNTNNAKAAFEALLADAVELGTQAGQGKDSQIKFDLKLIESAYLGLLDLSPNKHGEGVRDGKVLAESYYKAQTGASFFDHKQPSQRKLISNVDKCIHVGMQGKWGPGQPVAIVNDMLNRRTHWKEKGEKVEDAHNTLMRFLSNLKKRDDLPTEQEIDEIVLKKEPAQLDAEDIWERIKKLATGLRAGTIPNCVDQDTSAEIDRVVKNSEKRLKEIAKLRAQVEPATQQEEPEEPAEPEVTTAPAQPPAPMWEEPKAEPKAATA